MEPIVRTGPFLINIDRYAKAAYKLRFRRSAWIHALIVAVLTALLAVGIKASIPVALGIALLGDVVASMIAFGRFAAYVKGADRARAFEIENVTLTEESVREDFRDGSHLEFKRFAITNVAEVDGFFFITATRAHQMAIPYGGFDSRDDVDRFRQGLRR